MSLASKLAAGPVKRRDPRAIIQTWLESLSDEDRAAAIAAMTGFEWSTPDLRTEFAATGLQCSGTLINNWRRKLRESR